MKFLLTLILLLTAIPCTAEMLSVVHLPAELRSAPAVASSKVLAKLPRYAPLQVVETGSEYLKVKDASGRTGYIHKSLVAATPSLTIKADSCNLRKGPGTNHPIAFKATRGESFRAVSKQKDWIEILDHNDNTAWIWENLTWGY